VLSEEEEEYVPNPHSNLAYYLGHRERRPKTKKKKKKVKAISDAVQQSVRAFE
jgi:hypothetical protein